MNNNLPANVYPGVYPQRLHPNVSVGQQSGTYYDYPASAGLPSIYHYPTYPSTDDISYYSLDLFCWHGFVWMTSSRSTQSTERRRVTTAPLPPTSHSRTSRTLLSPPSCHTHVGLGSPIWTRAHPRSTLQRLQTVPHRPNRCPQLSRSLSAWVSSPVLTWRAPSTPSPETSMRSTHRRFPLRPFTPARAP